MYVFLMLLFGKNVYNLEVDTPVRISAHDDPDLYLRLDNGLLVMKIGTDVDDIIIKERGQKYNICYDGKLVCRKNVGIRLTADEQSDSRNTENDLDCIFDIIPDGRYYRIMNDKECLTSNTFIRFVSEGSLLFDTCFDTDSQKFQILTVDEDRKAKAENFGMFLASSIFQNKDEVANMVKNSNKSEEYDNLKYNGGKHKNHRHNIPANPQDNCENQMNAYNYNNLNLNYPYLGFNMQNIRPGHHSTAYNSPVNNPYFEYRYPDNQISHSRYGYESPYMPTNNISAINSAKQLPINSLGSLPSPPPIPPSSDVPSPSPIPAPPPIQPSTEISAPPQLSTSPPIPAPPPIQPSTDISAPPQLSTSPPIPAPPPIPSSPPIPAPLPIPSSLPIPAPLPIPPSPSISVPQTLISSYNLTNPSSSEQTTPPISQPSILIPPSTGLAETNLHPKSNKSIPPTPPEIGYRSDTASSALNNKNDKFQNNPETNNIPLQTNQIGESVPHDTPSPLSSNEINSPAYTQQYNYQTSTNPAYYFPDQNFEQFWQHIKEYPPNTTINPLFNTCSCNIADKECLKQCVITPNVNVYLTLSPIIQIKMSKFLKKLLKAKDGMTI